MVKWLQWTNGNKCHSKLYQVNAIRNMCEWVLMPDQIISELNNEWQVWVLLNGKKWQNDCIEQMNVNAIVNCINKWQQMANIKQMANKWQLQVQMINECQISSKWQTNGNYKCKKWQFTATINECHDKL